MVLDCYSESSLTHVSICWIFDVNKNVVRFYSLLLYIRNLPLLLVLLQNLSRFYLMPVLAWPCLVSLFHRFVHGVTAKNYSLWKLGCSLCPGGSFLDWSDGHGGCISRGWTTMNIATCGHSSGCSFSRNCPLCVR